MLTKTRVTVGIALCILTVLGWKKLSKDGGRNDKKKDPLGTSGRKRDVYDFLIV